MDAGEMRRRILDEHGSLRALLDQIEPLADGFEKSGPMGAASLRDAALGLYESFATHLRNEEATLEPALRARGAEGARLAERLVHEHREQRELLTYLLGRLADNRHPTLLVAREVRNFVEYLRLDMAHEEATLLSVALWADTRER
jgi:hemerythrin-like domain-containing protein